MALGTEEATFNAAVDTLMAAWEACVDALSGDERTMIVWVKSKQGSLTANTKQGADSSALFDFQRKSYWVNNPNTTDNIPLEIGGRPLFWKVTNDAGDLT